MRTKQVAPWHLKPGMLLAPLRVLSEPLGSSRAYCPLGTIQSVRKVRGYFSGSAIWRVETNLGESLTYFGRTGTLPAESVAIIPGAAQ